MLRENAKGSDCHIPNVSDDKGYPMKRTRPIKLSKNMLPPSRIEKQQNGVKQTKYTLSEKQHHKRVVIEMLSRLYHPEQIAAQLKEAFGCKPSYVEALVRVVLEQWERDDQTRSVKQNRIAAEKRLASYLEECRTRFMNDKQVSIKDVMAVEKHLADLQGIMAPIQVDVNVSITANIAAVLANLSPEQIQESLDRQNALRAAAKVAVESHLLNEDIQEAVKGALIDPTPISVELNTPEEGFEDEE